MITFLFTLLLPFTLLGVLTVVQWARTPKMPADDSNRLNNITAWWLGLTRPEILAHAYTFFRQDVLKNVEDVERANKKDSA